MDTREEHKGAGADTSPLSSQISELIAALDADEAPVRQDARASLVEIGEAAVDPLSEALRHSHDRIRWGAAKALGEIGHPSAAEDLVHALEDRRSDIRWLAAEGLILMGADGLLPLLRRLIDRSDSVWLRDGASHVARTLGRLGYGPVVAPLLDALEAIDPAITVPQAAHEVLHTMEAIPPALDDEEDETQDG